MQHSPARSSPAANKSNSQLLCCCGTSGWAKVIACVQIFVAMTALPGFFNNAKPATVTPIDDANYYFKAMLGLDPTAQMVGNAFSLVLGFILLGAALTENTLLLLIWLVPSGVSLALLGVVTVILFLYIIAAAEVDGLGLFLLLLASLVMKTFFYFVIFLYREEILEKRKCRNKLNAKISTISKLVDEFHTVVAEK